MKEDRLRELLRGLAPSAKITKQGKWLMIPCPFAPWRHARGKDSNPSFGVIINDRDYSKCNCFTCGIKGPLGPMIERLQAASGNAFTVAFDPEAEEFFGGDFGEWREEFVDDDEPLTVLGDSYLDLFDDARGHPYLVKREIDDQTVVECGLQLDPDDGHGRPRIVFPVRTPAGELVGFSGRAVEDGVEPRVRDYFGLKKARILLGSHLVANAPRIVIVEGLFDWARMVQYGVPAVAAMHAGLTESQRDLLLELDRPLVAFYDRDKAGQDATRATVEAFAGELPVSTVAYPTRYVSDKAGRRLVKDPDELTYDEVMTMLESVQLPRCRHRR